MTAPKKLDTAADTPLTLRTLGGAGLCAAGTSDVALGPGKPLALLIYLALAPGRRVSRAFLVELLWADLEPERARNNLRQALFHLRKLLGEHALPGADELTLARDLEIDRDRFLRAVEHGHLEEAVALYAGPFLPDFGTPGAAAFERWADLERDRLRTAFIRSAELVVRRHLNESRIKDAQRLARRVRDEAPDQEAAWRLLLESIIAGRDFVAAAVEAEALEQLATADGVTLEPATRALIARARKVIPDQANANAELTFVAELIGREREFSTIIAAWDSVRSGRARHLYLSAPAGLGKTRLLRDVVARLRASGARVVESRGAPGDREIPYAFAGDFALAIAAMPGAAGISPASAATLIALNPALSSLLSGPGEAGGNPDALLLRRIHALSDLVHSVAYEQPFVLVVDDLHWLDESSYRVIEGLFGRVADARVLCLTAGRPARRVASESVSVVPLPALTEAQVGSLISALGTVPDDAEWARGFVQGVHAASSGSPLLILETLRLALDDGILDLGPTGWSCLNDVRLTSLLRTAEAVRQRVRSLPEHEKWVLVLLATIGMPLAGEALEIAAGSSTRELAESLAALERIGLVTRTDSGWIPAHDEIADASRVAIDERQRQTAERSIGTVLVNLSGADPQRLLRGLRHLVAAGDDRSVERHFRDYVRHARRRRDHRPLAELAAETLGEGTGSAQVRRLVATLPVAWRAGLWSRARQMAASTVFVLLVAGIGFAASARSGRIATAQRLVYTDSTQATWGIVAEAASFDGGTAPLVLSRSVPEFFAAARAFPEVAPSVSPDGRSVAWTQDSDDSTTLDIWIRTPAGTRRVTTQVRDDKVAGWLPDGSALVGMTNRWTPRDTGNYDIALFDTATGVARQVTSGRDHDGAAVVSPDGTRILFSRESVDGPARACVVAIDAADPPDCRLVGGRPIAGLLGWKSLTEIVVTLEDSVGNRPLVRYDWARNQVAVLYDSWVGSPQLSPDRRWVIGAIRTDGIRGFRDWVIPVDQPNAARRVDRPNSSAAAIRWWEGPADQSSLIDRVEFTDPTHTVLLGISTRMAIRALNASAIEIPVHAPVRWTSSDTLVATVDARGYVRPRTLGAVTITASLAGWRTTSRVVHVRGAVAVTVLDERWDDRWSDRWITFGDPRPRRVAGPAGIRGMWNHGDGTFPSLVVSKQGLSAREGLGAEFRVSTPITRDDWQRLRVILVTGIDTAALQRGDQKKAPASAGDLNGGCGARYPVNAGAYGRGRIGVTGAGSATVELGAVAKVVSTGAWWTIRVQVLPDGRCGVAINGNPIWLSRESIALDNEFRVRLGDESLATTIIHGPLRVWTGVRTDIDWSRPPVGARE